MPKYTIQHLPFANKWAIMTAEYIVAFYDNRADAVRGFRRLIKR